MEDGGPAFPVADWDYQTFQPKTVEEIRRLLSGMSLRDYFAAKAMQGMLSTANASCLNGLDGYEEITAKAAYTIADAMLRARQENSNDRS
ncbi:hypothetical protein CAL20_09635 [Bordetella genomosp. 4]|uniref:Uncharacterized protein n=2 Tax=Bordetella genomosp. 4 TaxID=463044 RepID=A0A261U780_9BORD|nr:hypothetical protein CAL20_09635 [Bordetella genomosp. 4]